MLLKQIVSFHDMADHCVSRGWLHFSRYIWITSSPLLYTFLKHTTYISNFSQIKTTTSIFKLLLKKNKIEAHKKRMQFKNKTPRYGHLLVIIANIKASSISTKIFLHQL